MGLSLLDKDLFGRVQRQDNAGGWKFGCIHWRYKSEQTQHGLLLVEINHGS